MRGGIENVTKSNFISKKGEEITVRRWEVIMESNVPHGWRRGSWGPTSVKLLLRQTRITTKNHNDL